MNNLGKASKAVGMLIILASIFMGNTPLAILGAVLVYESYRLGN